LFPASLFPASRLRISAIRAACEVPRRAWLEQHRSGVKDECEDRAVGLDEIKCLLQGAAGGDRVAERVTGDRLQQEGLTRPAQVGHRGGAVQDGGERSGRRLRVAMGEPQRREGVTQLSAVGIVQPGEGLLDTFGVSLAALLCI
jgi:hypothetical protein